MTDGNRIKKTSGNTVTRSFNGQRIAIRKGRVLSYVHADHLGSSSVETSRNGAPTASRSYYAYGSTRNSSGILQTDRTFTGQNSDSTGLGI